MSLILEEETSFLIQTTHPQYSFPNASHHRDIRTARKYMYTFIKGPSMTLSGRGYLTLSSLASSVSSTTYLSIPYVSIIIGIKTNNWNMQVIL